MPGENDKNFSAWVMFLFLVQLCVVYAFQGTGHCVGLDGEAVDGWVMLTPSENSGRAGEYLFLLQGYGETEFRPLNGSTLQSENSPLLNTIYGSAPDGSFGDNTVWITGTDQPAKGNRKRKTPRKKKTSSSSRLIPKSKRFQNISKPKCKADPLFEETNVPDDSKDFQGTTVSARSAHSKYYLSFRVENINGRPILKGFYIEHSLPQFPNLSKERSVLPDRSDIFSSNWNSKGQQFVCSSFEHEVQLDEQQRIFFSRDKLDDLKQSQAIVVLLEHLETMHVSVLGTNYKEDESIFDIYHNYFATGFPKQEYSDSELHSFRNLDLSDLPVSFSQTDFSDQYLVPSHLFPLGQINSNVKDGRFTTINKTFHSRRNSSALGKCYEVKNQISGYTEVKGSCVTKGTFQLTNYAGRKEPLSVHVISRHRLSDKELWGDLVSYLAVPSVCGNYDIFDDCSTTYSLSISSWMDRTTYPVQSTKVRDTSVILNNAISMKFPVEGDDESIVEYTISKIHHKIAIATIPTDDSVFVPLVAFGSGNNSASQRHRGTGAFVFFDEDLYYAIMKLDYSIELGQMLQDSYQKRLEIEKFFKDFETPGIANHQSWLKSRDLGSLHTALIDGDNIFSQSLTQRSLSAFLNSPTSKSDLKRPRHDTDTEEPRTFKKRRLNSNNLTEGTVRRKIFPAPLIFDTICEDVNSKLCDLLRQECENSVSLTCKEAWKVCGNLKDRL